MISSNLISFFTLLIALLTLTTATPSHYRTNDLPVPGHQCEMDGIEICQSFSAPPSRYGKFYQCREGVWTINGCPRLTPHCIPVLAPNGPHIRCVPYLDLWEEMYE